MINMDFSESFKNIDKLSKQLAEIQILQNQAFSSLDSDTYEHVKEIHADINDVVRKLKAGDTESIDNYLQKYSKIDARNTTK